ncbi:L,D-transpeptidase [Bacillus sp. 165]|nr:L,D-transpeptidase [Bacillus sp. 165]
MKEMFTPVPKQLIIINRATNQLAFFAEGQLVRVFPVATGKRSTPTPEGIFPISNKITNRPYYKENIPGGDPSNPLGDRWIGLDVNGTKGTTYAIHGNNNPYSIGKYVSSGCIRMYDEDVHFLFEQVGVGTVVIIKSFDEPWNVLALQYGFKIYA